MVWRKTWIFSSPLSSPPLPSPPLSSFPLLDFNEITIPETAHSPTMERFWIFAWCEMIEVLERKKTIESIYMKRGFIRLVYTILSQVVQQWQSAYCIARDQMCQQSQSGAEGLEQSWKTTFKAWRRWVLMSAKEFSYSSNNNNVDKLVNETRGNEAKSFFSESSFYLSCPHLGWVFPDRQIKKKKSLGSKMNSFVS